jgi:poly-gamma-glutamate capsule biosynthesis protein CapA/YwtB (metallophosphatase superfamily)
VLTIGILGDVMLGRAVGERLNTVSPADVWSPELRDLCGGCDLLICNLECCISDRGSQTERVPGKPFFFRAPPQAVDSLRAIGVQAVGLANNHALDYEEQALLDTLDVLVRSGIAVAGAGESEERARRGVIIEAGGVRLGLLAVSDHPRQYAAGPMTAGIAHARLERRLPTWVARELERLAEACELVIAFPHWGPNMGEDPASWQRRAAGELQAHGANLVAGHSAHVFHGIGWGKGGPLLFDLGDALDDYAVDPRLRNDLGVAAFWRPGDGEELELAGLTLDFCRTELAAGDDADWIARRLERACPPLGTAVERLAEDRFRISPR